MGRTRSTKPQHTRIGAYAILRDGDNLLLCRLSDMLGPHAGKWTLPGGGIEFGEHPEQAMVREVHEETGLHVRPLGIAGVDSVHKDRPDHRFHGIRIIYHAEVLGGDLRYEIEGSTDRCQWHCCDDLDQLTVVDLVDAARALVP